MGIHRLLHSSCCFLNTHTHTHSVKMATHLNSENARSRMMASSRGSVSVGKKEDVSSTGRVRAAGFHHVTACSRLLHVFKLVNHLFP